MTVCCLRMPTCSSYTRKTEVNTTQPIRTDVRAALLRQGLLIASDVPGVYGRTAEFEDTIECVDRLVTALGADDGPEVMRFPPIISRALFDRSGYLKSFPHLAGSVHSFAGGERAHLELLRSAEAGRDWSAALPHAGVVLTPAACYPVYPVLAGTLPTGGRLVDVMSYCFRREPSDDVGRMQMFRMHEFIRATSPESALEWRGAWVQRAEQFAAALGLEARTEVATDPFFGRGGKLLEVGQRDQRLKLEIVTPIGSDERPTAIISLNYHQDHFGSAFGITADREIAHTACVAFGLERIALALYRQHGVNRACWSRCARQALGL